MIRGILTIALMAMTAAAPPNGTKEDFDADPGVVGVASALSPGWAGAIATLLTWKEQSPFRPEDIAELGGDEFRSDFAKHAELTMDAFARLATKLQVKIDPPMADPPLNDPLAVRDAVLKQKKPIVLLATTGDRPTDDVIAVVITGYHVMDDTLEFHQIVPLCDRRFFGALPGTYWRIVEFE